MKLQETTIEELYELFRGPVFEQRLRRKDSKPMVDRHGGPVMQDTGRREIPRSVAYGINAIMYDDSILGIVVFQNMAMDAANHGLCSALPYGPGCATLKTAEEAEGQHLNDLPSQRQYARYVHVKAPCRKVVHTVGTDDYLIYPNGHIARPEMDVKPSGAWRVRGAAEYDNFGNEVAVYSVDQVLRGEVGAWRHADGKQKVFIRDFDHGSDREWRGPPYDIV